MSECYPGMPRTKEGMQIALANTAAKLDKAQSEVADLRTRLAAAEALNRDLRSAVDAAKTSERAREKAGAALATKDLELAAVQAREVKLREDALVLVQERRAECQRNQVVYDGHQQLWEARAAEALTIEHQLAALALPADSTALREACERVAELCRPGATDLNARVVTSVLGGAAK